MATRILNRIINWLGGHELAVLLALLAAVAGTLVFVEVADEVFEGDTQALDERILLALRDADDPSRPIGPVWMGEIGRDITALGGYSVLILVTICVIVWLWLDDNYPAMRFVIAAIVGGFLLSMVLKSVFDRPRPDIVPHLSEAYTSSFPSGHSMMSAIVYLTLGSLLARTVPRPELKFFFLAVPLLLSLLIGVSRVYMGVHYPSDVLGGWSAGLAWATFCWLVARRIEAANSGIDSG